MPFPKLPSDFTKENKTHIARLHVALKTLKLPVAAEAVAEKTLDPTTTEAIKKIQAAFKIRATGKLDEKTLHAVNVQLHDQHIANSKHRAANLHSLLDKLKLEVPKEEKDKRMVGEATRKAIENFQRSERLPVNGKVSEDVLTRLHERLIRERFYSTANNQRSRLHKKLQKVSKISKLNIDITESELKNRRLGSSSVRLIKAFQHKYNLEPTGIVDKATLDKIESVAASRGKLVKKMNVPPADQLKVVNTGLRLNTVSPKVADLHKNLSFLGYKIAEKEFKSATFGKTTAHALLAFQKKNGLPITGQYDRASLKKVNQLITAANPDAMPAHRYRVRGTVRNRLWEPQGDMVVKVFLLLLGHESEQPVASMKNFDNGFFDVAYDAPVNPVNGAIRDNFHLVVKLYAAGDESRPLASQKHFNVNEIHWVNFTESVEEDGTINYNARYLGDPDYRITKKIILKAIGPGKISDLKETPNERLISQVSLQTGLSTDVIMRHVLSELVSMTVDLRDVLTPEVFYAFISQNLPPDLPGDLLRGTSGWETIGHMVELTSSGVVFLEDSLQRQTLGNAVAQNLVSQRIKVDRDSIIGALAETKVQFALTKPILVGNGRLKTLLESSALSSAHHLAVAGIFIRRKGINAAFWNDVKSLEGEIGSDTISDLTTTIEVANISKNHLPTLHFLKASTGEGRRFKRASDIAKLDQDGIVSLINDNGKQVPENMPGDTIDEKVANFAAAIKSRSAFLYPAVSLLATTRRINQNALPEMAAVEKFIDEQNEFNLREQNLDKYLRDSGISLDQPVRNSLKILQRVHKLTMHSQAGAVLIDQKMHSSMQVYFKGKHGVMTLLKDRGVPEKEIHRLYEAAKTQYMKVLARITDFRRELYKDTPAAIISHSYSSEEIGEISGGVPDLETLFGSLDYCECEHCKSLYGPAAYLTDMLRFLKEHPARDASKTVKDVLFDRRPDLGNIKLNCENTNTALPYIDLVCEILENNLIGNKNFVYQTNLSQKELRAIPENVQFPAYSALAVADFPMNVSFNLWQAEARAYLNHLRVPRFELMEVFQDRTDPAAKMPSDIDIAAEFFNLSWKEKDLIITTRANAADQDKFWGFDTTQPKVDVSAFMKRSKLSYYEVLELLMATFVNPAANRSVVERTQDSCDTKTQTINNLTPAKFDLMHRFIRLWRKTGWKIWELDALLRNSKIANGVLDGAALISLKTARQLQEKLKIRADVLLAFYGDISREVRIQPERQNGIIQPHYNNLFQNIAITNPIDKNFKAIGNLTDKMQPIDASLPFNLLTLDANIKLGLNASGYTPVPTILSSLALTQSDFDQLVARTDNTLSVNSLSVLFRHVYLARGLKLSITDFLVLLGVTNTADPFADPSATAGFLEDVKFIKASGLSILQLDYVLNYRPDSSVGLRDESIVQLASGLREIMESSFQKVSFLTQLLSFDEDSLAPLTDADAFMTAFSSLQSLLVGSRIELSGADVSADEVKFIREFNKEKLVLSDGTPNPDAAANKAALVAGIKKAQVSADTILSDTVNQKRNQIISHVASAFGLTAEQASILLSKLTIGATPESLLAHLENEDLLVKSSSGIYKEINRSNFPDFFAAYTLLHKTALVVVKQKIEVRNLAYFVDNHAALNILDFSELPLTASAAANGYGSWKNLNRFLDFISKFPEPEHASIRTVLDLAGDSEAASLDILKEISALTQWDRGALVALESGLGIRHTDAVRDYLNAELYERMYKCFAQLKLAGVDAMTMLEWRVVHSDTAQDMITAQQSRQAVKARYEHDDWLDKMISIHDDLREKKRNALVEYHIDYSQRTVGDLTFGGVSMVNPQWTDSNSLFKYFLIDVEMSSCQLTSRIKQALSSVQLFVQRCFLNLESEYVLVTAGDKSDVSSPNAWSQWKWMKNYRVWEANRKIFFYPENWIEPELRDDKSPFFEELENELMQNEVTRENVEAAFLSYLHKVDEVSHLEVCGLYHEMEDLDPDEAGYETNIVHVLGRTRSVPSIYYYRTFNMNYHNWSAWEKIDVDITGDHVIPVVYNRKLHLFWLQFMEKPMKTRKVPAAQASAGPTDAPEPLKVMEIQLGWTVRKSAGWAAKKISKQKLIHPWERPHHAYNLKPYYLSKFNELYLDIYLSTSKEFNNNKFYDPNKALNPSAYSGLLQNPTYLTKNRFNENYLPWHSSSFVFNGEIKDIKLKGLGGSYTYSDGSVVWLNDSYDYVHENFGNEGISLKELEPIEFGPRLRLPAGMHFNNNQLTNNKNNSVNNSSLVVLEDSQTTTLLSNASDPFELVITQQDLQLDTMTTDHPLFYQDSERAFFISPEWEARLNNYGQVISQNRRYRFRPFYHPYTMLFIREFNRSGIDGLLNREIQTRPESFPPKNTFSFNNYSPSASVIIDKTAESDNVDFSFSGSYSVYNWELFFHAPLMVACRLMQNQKFEDATTWFHYVFNPTNIEGNITPQRYWVTRPFYEYNSNEYRKQRIESILSNLHLSENSEQLKAWRNNPFQPHVIARYRPVAYQKNVVMKYLDNLIAWGDMLFKRDTIESINEASLLYMLAYEILGERPKKVPTVKHEELTFNEIEAKLDAFGNVGVDVFVEDTLLPVQVVPNDPGVEPVPKIDLFYFCIPNNDFIGKYWDTIEDRLFKIRHCMNIGGVVRQLPLFEPPLDPALLVKAAAAGIDISSVLTDVVSPTPSYRFRIVVQRAIEFCSEVKSLGEKLLNALERKDVEQLSLMQSQNEIQLLEAVKEVRKRQIDEAVEAIDSLLKAKASAEAKRTFYESRPFMNIWEDIAIGLNGSSVLLDIPVSMGYLYAGVLKAIPDFLVGAAGFGGTPTADAETGGSSFGEAAKLAMEGLGHIAGNLDKMAAISHTLGSYSRRKDEWDFQGQLAAIEIDQIGYQISAAEIRRSIAEKDLENQELQIENAMAVNDFMQNKYTNLQLFNWMTTQISSVYFQAYQLAFDMAKKAEKCYMFELGITDSNIIQFGYWDSLKKGLLSGDKLMNGLQRLQAEYINQNKREFEITKHISLHQVAPLSLITLKETGVCTIQLPEWLFDMDYPGHYMRRIKNVSISIPCIVGPYTGVNCTLSLLRSETRMDATLNGGAYAKVDENDMRFRSIVGAISSIATSHAQNDTGMFELSFNDDRYLPFEGAGAISDWQISLPKENNYFEFGSLSDVILHISYTSRHGGGQLVTHANADLQQRLPGEAAKLFSLKHDFPTEWHRFLHPVGGTDQEFAVTLKPEHFPFFIRGKLNTVQIKKMDLFVERKDRAAPEFIANIKITSAAAMNDVAVKEEQMYDFVCHATRGLAAAALGNISLKIKQDVAGDFKSLSDADISNAFMLFQLGN